MRRGLVLAAVIVVVAAITAVVIVTHSGSQPAPVSAARASDVAGVSVVMVHPTIRAGSFDSAVVVNDSRHWLNYGGCSGLLPRTGPVYHPPPSAVNCLGYTPIAPHAHYRIPNPIGGVTTLRKPGWFRVRQPGNYWVVFSYTFTSRPGTAPPTSERSRLAYAPLTVVR
jgi:hypothetical protein